MSRPLIPPIVKELSVSVPPEQAFAAFTREVASWWPVATHSVAGTDGLGLVLDESGFVETLADGTACRWGSVLAWDPPNRLTMTWHPGQDPDPHTVVDVTFTADGGGTTVRLVHSGWEVVPLPVTDEGETVLDNYVAGWETVLGAYAAGRAVAGAA